MSKIYSEKFFKNIGAIKPKEQKKLRDTCFCIVGLGGTGGFCFENLLRVGCESFILYDADRFELSNFNRQTLATDNLVDVMKIDAAIRRANEVNSSAKIKKLQSFNSTNADTVKECDILIDGTDSLSSRLEIANTCKKFNKPYVFCSASNSRGIVSIFEDYDFEKAFQIPKDPILREKYKKCSSIVCPAASLAGTLAASQAISYVLGKSYIKAPEALFFDIFRDNMFWRAKLG